MPVKPQIRIEGLDAFRRDLQKVDPAFGKRMGQVNKKVAEKAVDRVVQRYQGRYRSMSPRTRAAFRALAQARAAKARFGSTGTPYVLGQVMGGRYPQFPSPPGFLWDTIGEAMRDIDDQYLAALGAAVRETGAFPGAR
jgi:hypothetical protein